MTTLIDYALLAGASYISTRSDKNKFPVPQDWIEITDFRKSDPTTGFEATSFQNGNEIVISYAGTYDDGNSVLFNPDKQADSALALGTWSYQLGQAADLYLQVEAANPDANITLTGHSLGGGLAALIGVMFGVETQTFDQAPFALAAESLAQALMNYLVDEDKYTTQQLSGLANFIQLQQDAYLQTGEAFIPNEDLVTNISVEGQFLDVNFPYDSFNTIGANQLPALASSHTGVSGEELHSQALLTAFLQSQQTATTYTADSEQETLSNVTYKLIDLMQMIFDPHLYANNTDPNTDTENFIDHLVRYEFGNAPSGVTGEPPVTADAMLTRFTMDALLFCHTSQ